MDAADIKIKAEWDNRIRKLKDDIDVDMRVTIQFYREYLETKDKKEKNRLQELVFFELSKLSEDMTRLENAEQARKGGGW